MMTNKKYAGLWRKVNSRLPATLYDVGTMHMMMALRRKRMKDTPNFSWILQPMTLEELRKHDPDKAAMFEKLENDS